MSYKERAQDIIDYLSEYHDEEDYTTSVFQGMIYFEFQSPQDTLTISSAILAELSESCIDTEDLTINIYLEKSRMTIAGA